VAACAAGEAANSAPTAKAAGTASILTARKEQPFETWSIEDLDLHIDCLMQRLDYPMW
jgi:hypothetical protein